MTRFVVDLGKAKLSEEKKNVIAAAIQTAVIQQLADQPHPGERQLCYIPWHWCGLIYRPDLGDIPLAERVIGEFANAPVGAE